MKDNRKTLSVKVDAEYAAAVWDFVYAHKMSLSDFLRAAINAYMEQDKNKEDE